MLKNNYIFDILIIELFEVRYPQMKKIPIIIDCDPGVDDSYAIALANSHPEFEIVALTCTRRKSRAPAATREIPGGSPLC